jgi:sorbitol-specific phosphotransferase system component IIC
MQGAKIAAHPVERWNGVLPILMSLTVLAMIVFELGKHGVHAPRHDEGGADHVAMLLMYGQLPVVASFIFSWRRELWRAAPVLAAQLLLWLLVFAAARLT